MKKILLLCDYKNRYGSKDNARPYRSGMDKKLLSSLFETKGWATDYCKLSSVFERELEDQSVLYTSQEDIGYKYKDYIEDIVLYLGIVGARTIPDYRYLRANNNKVFMELLRKELFTSEYQLESLCFGCLEEALGCNTLGYPVVVKAAKGASGTGVFLAKDKDSLAKYIKKVAATPNIKQDFRDVLRGLKHKDYQNESRYRERFILQKFLKGLQNDWKVYVFWDTTFVFYRPILKKRVFKASGGGYDNYAYGTDAKIPEGLLDFALNARRQLDVPNVSLDIAYDGSKFYLIEYQCLYFGTAGISRSRNLFKHSDGDWGVFENKETLESIYVHSIHEYLTA